MARALRHAGRLPARHTRSLRRCTPCGARRHGADRAPL